MEKDRYKYLHILETDGFKEIGNEGEKEKIRFPYDTENSEAKTKLW